MTDTTKESALESSVDAGPKRSPLQAWGMTGMLVVLYMINWADKSLLGLVAQPLSEEFGLTASQIGLISGAFYLAFTVGGFGAGLLNRFAGLRWAIALLALAWAFCMLPVPVAGGFAVILVSRFLLGLFEGPSSALIHTAVYSWHPPEKRSFPGAWIQTGGSLGKILLAPALAFVIYLWGWRASFYVMAAVGILWCLVWLMAWKVGPYATSRRAPASEQQGHIGEPLPTVSWKQIFLTPTFLAAAVGVASIYSLVTVVLTWLPSYFELGLGFSRLQAGTMFGFPSIAGVAALFVIGLISDRLFRRLGGRWARGVLPALALLFSGLSLVLLPVVPGSWEVVLLVSVGYGVGISVLPLFNAAVSQLCPPEKLAGTLGVFLALMAVGGLVAPYITGAIVDAAASPAQGYAAAFQVFGVAVLLGGVIALIFVNPERDARKIGNLSRT